MFSRQLRKDVSGYKEQLKKMEEDQLKILNKKHKTRDKILSMMKGSKPEKALKQSNLSINS